MSDFHAPRSLSVDFTHPNPTIVSAYSICRAAEHVVDQPLDDPTMKAKLINIRILGHLLSQSCLLQDEAISRVAISIVSCRRGAMGPDERDVEALNELGQYYRNYLVRPFRKFKRRTPDISSPPSRPSSKLTKEKLDQILADTSKSYSKWRDLAMQREDFRCIVTRVLDMTYAEKNQFPRDTEVQTLEFCHIFAESTNYDINTKDDIKKFDCSSNVWSLLKSFGYTKIVDDLASSEKIHSLENVMAMCHTLRDHFDKLNMWFEPIEGAANNYRIRAVWGLPSPLTDGQEVTFQSTDPRLALPNQECLRIHAACCMVAHLSGASGFFNELERDMASDPDPTTEAQDFARALHAHLDHLALTANETR